MIFGLVLDEDDSAELSREVDEGGRAMCTEKRGVIFHSKSIRTYILTLHVTKNGIRLN